MRHHSSPKIFQDHTMPSKILCQQEKCPTLHHFQRLSRRETSCFLETPRSSNVSMSYSFSESSLPKMATASGKRGSAISERIIRNAPFSSHSNEVRPYRRVSGTRPCVPVVFQCPINTLKGLRAGFSMDAFCAKFRII